MKKSIWLLIALMLTASSYVGAQTQQNNYERGWLCGRILDAMSLATTDGLQPIIAHRGYWRGAKLNETNTKWFPENSIAAVLNAHLNGIEAVEIDLRSTADGYPILIHDTSFGRTTGQSWNPMTHIGTNNTVRFTNFADIPTYLRAWDYINNKKVVGSNPKNYADYNGVFTGNYLGKGHKLFGLVDLLKWHEANNIKVVLFLEIQSLSDLKNIYKVVKDNKALDYCVFKLGIAGGPPEGYFDTLVELGIFKKVLVWAGDPVMGIPPVYTYNPIAQTPENEFNFITICYEDTKQAVKNFIDKVHSDRSNNKKNNINHIFAELVAKTKTVIDMPWLYSVALSCQAKGIRTGGYWVIPGANVTQRNSTIKVNGFFTKSGANISNQGEPLITQPGSCCGGPGSNEFQLYLSHIIMPLTQPVNSVLPIESGMGSTLVTSDEVEKLEGILARTKKDIWYKPVASLSLQDNIITNINHQDNSISAQINDSVIAYPNPVENELNVTFVSENIENSNISLVSIEGKVLIEQKQKTTIGTNTVVVGTQALPNGTYILKVQIGTEFITKKVVVNK